LFPRDLWVEDIPGWVREDQHGVRGRIDGVALSAPPDGEAALRDAIHHVLYVNLLGFQRVVDALRGVDMCVPYPMSTS
jgi:anionic cell wall polymer biosynthesis LytR-Cps2A-Psr (LCP) family protein